MRIGLVRRWMSVSLSGSLALSCGKLDPSPGRGGGPNHDRKDAGAHAPQDASTSDAPDAGPSTLDSGLESSDANTRRDAVEEASISVDSGAEPAAACRPCVVEAMEACKPPKMSTCIHQSSVDPLLGAPADSLCAAGWTRTGVARTIKISHDGRLCYQAQSRCAGSFGCGVQVSDGTKAIASGSTVLGSRTFYAECESLPDGGRSSISEDCASPPAFTCDTVIEGTCPAIP
jgi:hypothetical protein